MTPLAVAAGPEVPPPMRSAPSARGARRVTASRPVQTPSDVSVPFGSVHGLKLLFAFAV